MSENKIILQHVDELMRLAADLEEKSTTWARYDLSRDPKFPSREYEALRKEEKRQSDDLWQNAVRVGHLLFALLDIGALDFDSRLRNAMAQVHAEVEKAKKAGKPPQSHFSIVNLPYSPKDLRPNYDAFYVKAFETFDKLWAKSFEDKRACQLYYVTLQEKAKFHVKMMRSLGNRLENGFDSGS